MSQELKQNITSVQERIIKAATLAGRDPKSVRLVTVTKTIDTGRMRQAADAGISLFGENYIQEAREKTEEMADLEISWHFIGHLQSNKAKYAVRMFDLIHTVDSVKLGKEINRCAKNAGKIQDILIQANLAKEATKSGVTDEGLADLTKALAVMENIRIRGLMTMPPFFDDPDRARPYFARLARCAREIDALKLENVSMEELSMGMTGDFEAAIKEGATLVRVGTAIFGKRL